MKILLVNPPSPFLKDENVFPTLGLLYLSSYLKQAGYTNISILDLNGKHDLPKSLYADIVGFYSSTPQFPNVLKLREQVEKINSNKSAIYIIGGPHVSGKPGDAEPYFDYVIIGEGERVLLDIVKGIDSKKYMTDKVVKYEYMKDINEIPFPDRDLIDVKNYKYFINGRLATALISSRGCPYGCYFCANNAWGNTLRLRSLENVIEEIKFLINKYGYKAFMFFDDTITVNKKRMKTLCAMLGKLDVFYRCFIRSDTVDKDILLQMKQSGCKEVGLGVESGSQRILNLVNKGERIEQHINAIKMCKDIGIRVKGFFILGLPGENEESVKETRDFLSKNNIDDFDMTIFTPYPGSKIYNEREKYDINFNEDYENYWYKGKPGCYRSVVSTSMLSSKRIAELRDEIEKEFKRK